MQPLQNDFAASMVVECSWETVDNYDPKRCFPTATDDSVWDEMSEWWLAECEDYYSY